MLPCHVPAMISCGQMLVSLLPHNLDFSNFPVSSCWSNTSYSCSWVCCASPQSRLPWGPSYPSEVWQFWCLHIGIIMNTNNSLDSVLLVTVKYKLIHHPNYAWVRWDHWHSAVSWRKVIPPVHHLHHAWSFSCRYLFFLCKNLRGGDRNGECRC